MTELSFPIPDGLIEQIAERVADILAEREAAPLDGSPFFTIGEAAEYLRCSKQHIYDLRSDARLSRLTAGGRAIVRRSECDQLVDTPDGRPHGKRDSRRTR